MAFVLAAKIDLARNLEKEDERYAVRQLKGALNRLGFYTPDPRTGMTDEIDIGLKDAVYAFQRKATIFFDNVDIGPGSTTERILNRDLAAMDEHAFYIWRTVGDNKVRGVHAARNGQTFSWANPPGDESPGEDYNCRCWAEPINPPYHPWIEWANKRREERVTQSSVVEKLAPPKDVKDKITDLMTSVPVDAINPTSSPLDFVGWGAVPAAKYIGRPIVAEIAKRQLAREAATRDVEWIRNADIRQIQHAFGKAEQFGVQGNWNKANSELFKDALQKHIRSPDTKVMNGFYHKDPVKHYYNSETKLNVMQKQNGNFISGWKLNKDQIYHMENGGKLGGSKR